MTDTQEVDYYYVIFTFFCTQYGEVRGSTVVRQYRSPDGFNIASTQKYLRKLLDHECLIESWMPITKKRYEEMLEYIQVNSPEGQSTKLTVLQGGGTSMEKKTGHLHPVEPEPKA